MKLAKSTEVESHIYRPSFTSREELDKALAVLRANSQSWVDLTLAERISIAEEVHRSFPKVCQRWVDLSVAAKGTSDRLLGNDRDWLDVAAVNRIHALTVRSLKEIRDSGRPRVPGGYRLTSNGQVAARVYPDSLAQRLAFRGVEIDVLLDPTLSLEEAISNQALAYNSPSRKGKVALVLGAGNASTLPCSDTFHKLFHDLRTVILKMNPVNAYLGPLLEEAYEALITRGFLRIVYGGASEGNYLVHHELVDEVHMTGSDKTFDTIVFGPGEEGRKRKRQRAPLVKKKVEGELGCITPWLVVPGEWSNEEIHYQANKMAFWMTRHEGYVCFAPRILVVKEDWPQRKAFLNALVQALSKVAPTKAYYPGSAEKQRLFIEAHPEAIQVHSDSSDHIPWTVIPDLDPTADDEICYRLESFSGLCGEVPIVAESVKEFIDRAVDFLNNRVWGTLSATIVVSEASLANPGIKNSVEAAISNLRYGTVALNTTGVYGYASMVGPWGGFPGSSIFDIQSGNEKVTNSFMLHKPVKTVIRAPFQIRPYPFFGTAKDLDVFAEKLSSFQLESSIRKLPGLFWSALKTES